MFGYILPEKPELKIKEYEMFRAYYCGVCKSIGRRNGQLSRLVLNYDCTFLALLLSSLVDKKLDISRERCIVHPAAKRPVIVKNSMIDYASDMNVVLAYYKLMDNWNDEKSVLSSAAMRVLKHNFTKLRKKYHEKCGIIEERLKELAALEKEKCNSVDIAAEPFAKLMEEITAYEPLCKDEKLETAIRWLGYNIGKWIYVLDAYDDIEKDIKKKTYNPFLYQYSYNGESLQEFKCKIKDATEFMLTFTLSQIAKAYELMDKKINSSIVENIIYMGMLRKTENILCAGSCSKIEKSI